MTLKQFEVLQNKQQRSGLSETAFCKSNAISYSTSCYWKRKRESSIKHSVGFVEIRPSNTLPLLIGPFEIAFSNGRVLRVPQSFDSASLQELLSILDS